MNNIPKFTESHGFCGDDMTMEINGTVHKLNVHKLENGKYCSYAEHAVLILKEIYDIDMKSEDVKFVWDGSL